MFSPRLRSLCFYLLVIFLVGVLCLSVIFNFRIPLVSKVVFFLFSPLVDISTGMGGAFRKGFQKYVYLVKVKEENQRLRQENEALKTQLVRLKEELFLLKSLQKEALPSLKNYPKVLARVIYKPFSPFESYLIIDQGQNANLFPEAPVVSAVGGEVGVLVGQVVEVSWRHAKVLPITAPASAVDVLSVRSRDRGLLRGQGKGAPCLLDYVPYGSDLREGDLLITSGMDALYPKGIRVGRVLRVSPERKQGFFETVEVAPLCDFQKLEYVYVILKPRAFKP